MPMLIKYLILDGTDYKTISSGTLTKVSSLSDTDTAIETSFRTSGMNDLTQIDNSIVSQIVSSEYKVVMYKGIS